MRLLEGGLSAFARSRAYPVHAAWLIMKFVNHFLYWWILWGARGGNVKWNFPMFLLTALPAVVLYLQSALLVSSSPRSVSSWRDHYYSIARPFFGLNVVYLLLTLSIPWASEGYVPPPATLVVMAIAVGAWITAMVSQKPGIHVAVAAYAMLLNMLTVALLAFTPPPD